MEGWAGERGVVPELVVAEGIRARHRDPAGKKVERERASQCAVVGLALVHGPNKNYDAIEL